MLARSKEAWLKFKEWFVEYHSATLIGATLRKTSPEDWDDFLQKSFKKAKDLSDFVAILMRAAFVFMLFRFFAYMAEKDDFWLSKFALGTNSFLCFILYLFILMRISQVVYVYWGKDTSHHNSLIAKIIIAAISLIQMLFFTHGVSVLVRAFASTSNLFN